MEGESGVSPNIIDELHPWDIQGEQMVGPIVLMEVSLMNLFLHIAKEVK